MSGGPKIPPQGGATKLPGVGLQQPIDTRPQGSTRERATTDPAREQRAAGLTHKNRTNSDHLARGIAHIPGRISSPTVVASAGDLGAALEEATLVARTRMVDGAKVGPARVRPGTTVEARVAVANREVDYKNTEILFRDPNGELTDLDGPWIWDAEKIYIDSEGHIRADVPCFPDPNITKTVLGEEHDKVPKDPGAFMAALGKRANMPEIPLIPGTTTSAAAGVQKSGTGPRAAVDSATGPRAATTTVAAAESAGKAKGQLSDAFDMSALTFAVEGLEPGSRAKLKPGPLRLGDGTILNLDAGAEIRIPENKPGEMQVEIVAPIRSLQMEANGTVVRTGAGRIKLDLDFAPTGDSVPAGGSPMQVKIRELHVDSLDLDAPAGVGQHTLRVRKRPKDTQPYAISVTAKDDEQPILSYASGANGPSIKMELPDVHLSAVTGELEIEGTDGKPARLTLGDDGTGGLERPLSIDASITIDTAAESFVFDSHIADIAATMTPVALIDTQDFDLALAKSTITGGGHLKVTSVGGKHVVAMHADPSNPLRVSAAIGDAKIGASKRAPIAELPEALRATATRIQGLADADDNPDTVSVDDVRAAMEQPDIFTAAQRRQFAAISQEIEKKGTNLQLDLGAGTNGHLAFDTLVFGSDGTPVIRGHAEPNGVASFGVEIDALSLELPGGHNINLGGEVDANGKPAPLLGKLVVNHLDWAANDKSPVVDAYVRIDLRPQADNDGTGAHAILRPGEVPGLEQATVKVDAKTGQSYIEIKATIDKDGHVDCPIDIRIRNFEVQTQLEKGGLAPLPEQRVPDAPLERRAPVGLQPMRTLTPPQPVQAPPAGTEQKAEVGPPKMPTLSIPPAELFGAVDDTVVTVTIGPDELDNLVLPQGDNRFTFRRPAGPITARFTLKDGKLVPGESRITFDPPLEIDTVIAGPTPNVDLTIRGGVLKKDGDRATLDLDLDYDHDGVKVLSFLSFGAAGSVLESIVEEKVCELVTGQGSLPLDGGELVREVSRHLGLPATIEVGGQEEEEQPPAQPARAAPTAPSGPERSMVARKPGVDDAHPLGDDASYDRLIEQMEGRFHHWDRRGKGLDSAEAGADNAALARSFGRQLRREIVDRGGAQALARVQNDRHVLERVQGLLGAANERDRADNTIRDDNLAAVARQITGELGVRTPEQNLFDAMNLDSATLAVENATFTASRIPLGGTQGIEIRPGSDLTISGNPNDFTISGDAVFGNVDIGNADLAAKLQSGEGNLTVHVTGALGGNPRVVIDVKELHATGMDVRGRVGAGTSKLEDATVRSGWIHVAVGGDEPDVFRVALTGVEGNLEGGGMATHKGGRGALESLSGSVEGDITWENGQLTGALSHIDMSVKGMAFSPPGSSGQTRGDIHVSGAARFLTDADGRVVISRNGDETFLTDATVVTPDGATFTITGGEADELTIDPGIPPNVLVSNLRGELSCVNALATNAAGQPTSILDIRHADLVGTVRFGRDGLRTEGKVEMTNVDASVGNLTIQPTGQSLLALRQIDFSGRGFLERGASGAWMITGERVEDANGVAHSTLTTHSTWHDVKFATDSPELHLDLTEDGYADAELYALTVGGDKPSSIHLGRGTFAGIVERGDVVVGSEESVLHRANFRPSWRRMAWSSDESDPVRRSLMEALGGADEGAGWQWRLDRQSSRTGYLDFDEPGRWEVTVDGMSFLSPAQRAELKTWVREKSTVEHTLVELDVTELKTGVYSAGNAMATDFTLRVQGEFADKKDQIPASVAEYGVELASMGLEGDMRMVLRAKTDGKGNFSARSHTIFNADARLHVNADIDPAAAYERAKQALRERAARRAAAEEDN